MPCARHDIHDFETIFPPRCVVDARARASFTGAVYGAA
jgi:hypothetical protein